MVEIMALPGCPPGEFWEEGSRHCVSCSTICDRKINGEDSDCSFRCPAYFEEQTTMESVATTPKPVLSFSSADSQRLVITMACASVLLLIAISAICVKLALMYIKKKHRNRNANSDMEDAVFVCCKSCYEPDRSAIKGEVGHEDETKTLIGPPSESTDSSGIGADSDNQSYSVSVHSKDSSKGMGTSTASGTPDNKQVGSLPGTQNNKQPGSSPDTQHNKQPRSSPDTQHNKQPGSSPDTQHNKQPGSSPDTQHNKQPGSSPDTQHNKQPRSSPDTQHNKQPGSSTITQHNKQHKSSPDTQHNNQPRGSPDTQHNKQPGSSTNTQHNKQPKSSPDTQYNNQPRSSPDTQNNKQTSSLTDSSSNALRSAISPRNGHLEFGKTSSKNSLPLNCIEPRVTSVPGVVETDDTETELKVLSADSGDLAVDGGPPDSIGDNQGQVSNHSSMSGHPLSLSLSENIEEVGMEVNLQADVDSPVATHKSISESVYEYLDGESWVRICMFSSNRLKILVKGKSSEEAKRLILQNTNLTEEEITVATLVNSSFQYLTGGGVGEKHSLMELVYFEGAPNETDDKTPCTRRYVLRSSTIGGFLETKDDRTQYLITSGHYSSKGTKYYLDQSLTELIGTCEFNFWDDQSDIAFVRLEAGAKDKLCNHLVLSDDGTLKWFSPQILKHDLLKLKNSNHSTLVYKYGPRGLVPGNLVPILIDKDEKRGKRAGIAVTDWPAGTCSAGDSGSLVVADPVFPHVAAYGLVTGLFTLTVRYGENQTKEENMCGVSPLWHSIKRVQELQRTHNIPVQDFRFVKCTDTHGARASTRPVNEPAPNSDSVYPYQPLGLPAPNESPIANNDTFERGAAALVDDSSDAQASLFGGSVENDVETDGPPSALLEADPKGRIDFSDDEAYFSRLESSFVTT